MCFLSSSENLKFGLDRVQINMLKIGKMADFGIFLLKMSEIVTSFYFNLYIIKILGRYIKLMCKNYRFMCENFKTIIYLQFCYIFFVNTRFFSIL